MHCGPPNQNFGRAMAHPATLQHPASTTPWAVLLNAKLLCCSVVECAAAVSGDIVRSPESQTAFIGDKASFVCSSTVEYIGVDWELKRFSSGQSEWIVKNGEYNETYAGKFEIIKFRPRPEPDMAARKDTPYQVVIHDVELDDAGEYTCHDAGGDGDDSASANLTVMEHPSKRPRMFTCF